MSSPVYERIVGGLRTTGGSPQCFPIGFTPRSRLVKLIIMQTGGTPTNFTAQLYNSARACAGDSQSASADQVGEGGAGELPRAMFEVGPKVMSQDVGELREYFTEQNVYFFSHDEGPLGQDRTIYLEIDPQGSGDCEFAVTLGAETVYLDG